MTLWYTQPAALSILSRSGAGRPPLDVWQDRDGRWRSEYRHGGRVKALAQLWLSSPCEQRPLGTSFGDVLWSIYGEPEGLSGDYLTHYDTHADSAAIRANMHAAALEHGHHRLAKRIAKRQARSGD